MLTYVYTNILLIKGISNMNKNELEKLNDTTDTARTTCILVLYMLSILGYITLFTFIIKNGLIFTLTGFGDFLAQQQLLLLLSYA